MSLTFEEEISELSGRLFAALGPDKKLALDFFAIFSRFEYAIKRIPCLKEGKKASADWYKFAGKYLCLNSEISEKIKSKAKYLENIRPKEQICNGYIHWESPPLFSCRSWSSPATTTGFSRHPPPFFKNY